MQMSSHLATRRVKRKKHVKPPPPPPPPPNIMDQTRMRTLSIDQKHDPDPIRIEQKHDPICAIDPEYRKDNIAIPNLLEPFLQEMLNKLSDFEITIPFNEFRSFKHPYFIICDMDIRDKKEFAIIINIGTMRGNIVEWDESFLLTSFNSIRKHRIILLYSTNDKCREWIRDNLMELEKCTVFHVRQKDNTTNIDNTKNGKSTTNCR